MTKRVTATTSLIERLTSAQPVDPGPANRRRGSVDIPDAIREQVKVMAETGKILPLDITDEDEFQTLKVMYLDAAYELGYSAHVVKTHDNPRDMENRKWVGTRISVRARMGRRPSDTNGEVTHDAQDTTEGEPAPEMSRGW